MVLFVFVFCAVISAVSAHVTFSNSGSAAAGEETCTFFFFFSSFSVCGNSF